MHVLQYQHMRKEYLQSPICSFYHHYYDHFYATYKEHCYIIVYLRCTLLDIHACTLHILCVVVHFIRLLCSIPCPQFYGAIMQRRSLGIGHLMMTKIPFFLSSAEWQLVVVVDQHKQLHFTLKILLCYLVVQFPMQLCASLMLIITLLSTKVLIYRYIHCKLQQFVAKWRGGKMKLLNRKACLPKKV